MVFGPTLNLILRIFRELKKGQLHVLKKVGLNTYKDIFKKYVYNITVMFFNIFLFCLKGYSETLIFVLSVKKFNICTDVFNTFITIDSRFRSDLRWYHNQSALYLLLLLLFLLLLLLLLLLSLLFSLLLFALDIFNFEKQLVLEKRRQLVLSSLK